MGRKSSWAFSCSAMATRAAASGHGRCGWITHAHTFDEELGHASGQASEIIVPREFEGVHASRKIRVKFQALAALDSRGLVGKARHGHGARDVDRELPRLGAQELTAGFGRLVVCSVDAQVGGRAVEEGEPVPAGRLRIILEERPRTELAVVFVVAGGVVFLDVRSCAGGLVGSVIVEMLVGAESTAVRGAPTGTAPQLSNRRRHQGAVRALELKGATDANSLCCAVARHR